MTIVPPNRWTRKAPSPSEATMRLQGAGGARTASKYGGCVLELHRLRSDHAPATLVFELENRTYFAGSITDRGDEFFEQFPERHRTLLAEQEAGVCICHVLVDQQGTVLGRFNLYELADRTAEVGYRVAQQVADRGVATASLHELCRLAREQYGLQTLTAKVSEANRASRRVLEKVGFVSAGDCIVAGEPGVRYALDLPLTADR